MVKRRCAQATDLERGMALGVDDMATKPFEPSELVELIRSLVLREVGRHARDRIGR